jgi:cyclophilin family peptidyl-prolyl cis-trans isomerase
MLQRLVFFSGIFLLLCAAPLWAAEQLVIETNKGNIRVELDAEKAPESVKNFLTYVDAGFYEGTVFHRVIKDFMIQGGGFDATLKMKKGQPAIRNEANNGLKNLRGTLAMARTNVVDSATSQFFINLKDNTFLDHRDKTAQGFGYAVFGRVVEGMDVVDRIGTSPTRRRDALFSDLPADQVVITAIRRLKE